jgi:hypothetical protein
VVRASREPCMAYLVRALGLAPVSCCPNHENARSLTPSAILCGVHGGGLQVYAWGRGDHGVLGIGSDRTMPLPTPVLFGAELGLVRVKSVACSWFHSVSGKGIAFLPVSCLAQ